MDRPHLDFRRAKYSQFSHQHDGGLFERQILRKSLGVKRFRDRRSRRGRDP